MRILKKFLGALSAGALALLTNCSASSLVSEKIPSHPPTSDSNDVVSPTVSMISPLQAGAWVTRVSALANDDTHVSRVEIYQDAELLVATLNQPPYNFDFDTSSVGCGLHSFYDKAFDAAGNSATSSRATLTILPTTVLQFDPGAIGPNVKTYVAWDLDLGKNLGSSAKQGADCCRPAADPVVRITLPDFKSHRIGIYALDSGGLYLQHTPIASFNVALPTCFGL